MDGSEVAGRQVLPLVEANGNLSLFRARDAQILWSSDTLGSAVTLNIQDDGNLVVH